MTSLEYWALRHEKLFDDLFNKYAATGVSNLGAVFGRTVKELDKLVADFYEQYGVQAFDIAADGSKVLRKELVLEKGIAYKDQRLIALRARIDESLIRLHNEELGIMSKSLDNAARAMYYDNYFLVGKQAGVCKSFNVLSDYQIKALYGSKISGKNFATRAGINNAHLASNLKRTMTQGIITGKSNAAMSKVLQERMNVGKSIANRLINTEVANTLNQAALESYADSGVVTHYRFLATLDNVTSEICTIWDGEEIPIQEAQTGLNFPPLHPNCRSTTIPVMNSIMIDRIARLPSGQHIRVPASMTVTEFREKYVA